MTVNITSILYALKDSFIMGCKVFKIILTLRATFLWFPNFNAYQQPLYSLSKLTDPFFEFFSVIFPSIGGFDVSHVMAIWAVGFFVDTITQI
jgi:uncharacterized protein YggT (Ycf19 family)